MAEVALIQLQVQVEEARGNLAAAWDFEKSVVAVAQQHVGEPGAYAVFQEMVASRSALLAQYRAGGHPPQLELGCYYDSETLVKKLFGEGVPIKGAEQCSSGSRDAALTSMAWEIRDYQLLALEALLGNDGYASAELLQLVDAVMLSSEQIRRWQPFRAITHYDDPVPGNLLLRLVSYQPRNQAETVQRGYLLVKLADTNVLRARNSRVRRGYEQVLQQYERAYEVLRNAGVEQSVLDMVFSPEVPVVLPVYESTRLDVASEAATDAYVDVRFKLTARGTADEVEVTGTSEGLRLRDRREVVDLVKNGVFRPRLVNGRVVDAAAVAVRYRAGD
jgi:hypothetical protein